MHLVIGPMVVAEGLMLAGAITFVARGHSRAIRQPLHVQVLDRSGPRYVFLHGLGATHRYWQRQLETHPLPGKVTMVDLLGFGDSPKPWFRHNVERHVEKLRAAIGSGESDLILVGHSLGAALALAYAARFPGQIRKLVLLSLPWFSGGERDAYHWLRRRAEGWLFTNVALMTVACVFTRGIIGPLIPYLRPDLPREVAEDVVKHSWMASTTSLWDVVYRHDFTKDADALPSTLPVICVHGDRDMTIPPDGVCKLASGRGNWRMVTLPDVDHHPWLRQPRKCRELIIDGPGPNA